MRGHVRIRSFTEDPSRFSAYGPLTDKTGGRRFPLRILSSTGDASVLVCAIEGVATREAAERLKGVELYARRSALPPLARNEWYAHELIGLEVRLLNGESVGSVVDTHHFGAGELLEIAFADGRSEMFAFNDKTFPEVDVIKQYIIFNPPKNVEVLK